SPAEAYSSIRFIQREVTGGALVRGMHHWAASAMVVLVTAHMIRVFTGGAYKYPRESNWVLGVVLFGLVLGFSFTGYLLPWDQKAYWATEVGTRMAATAPVVGDRLLILLRGGPELGAATLTRFYAFHVLWLPAAIGILILLHLVMVVRQGIAPHPAALEIAAPPRTDAANYPEFYQKTYAATKHRGFKFWPDIIAKDALVSLGVVAIIIGLATVSGATLELPADRTDTSYVPRPEWYFLPLYQLLKLVPGSLESVVAVGVPTALVLALLALPFFDRKSTRSLRHRPLALTSLAGLLGASGLLIGAALHSNPAPPAVDVTRSEMGLTVKQRSGRALVAAQGCSSCHRINGEGGELGPDLSASGLKHSVGWMHSFIEQPSRFRANSPMPPFGPPKLTHDEIEEIAQYLSTLRGGAGPEVEPQFADTFP
ncbi:MAG: cytochrome b N-terminal domain-containing protein, partial [Gemmatimonadetes bacterium]|nr:cytochrome b N-terminal domain-containing protein [Gemmatimonadota bacterium]